MHALASGFSWDEAVALCTCCATRARIGGRAFVALEPVWQLDRARGSFLD